MKSIFTKEQLEKHDQFSYHLSKAFVNFLPANKSVIDFGCGKGEYLDVLQRYKMKCFGYDGCVGVNEVSKFKGIKKLELHKKWVAKKGSPKPKGSVICIDVIEHIPENNEKTVLKNITDCCDGRLVIQWSANEDSENPKKSIHILPTIEGLGFEFNLNMTEKFRNEAGANIDRYRRTIYVFDRK